MGRVPHVLAALFLEPVEPQCNLPHRQSGGSLGWFGRDGETLYLCSEKEGRNSLEKGQVLRSARCRWAKCQVYTRGQKCSNFRLPASGDEDDSGEQESKECSKRNVSHSGMQLLGWPKG